MRKKHLTWMLAALFGLFFTACSNEETVPGTEGNESNIITFTMNRDYGVRTRATTPPTIPPGKVLRYIMEVYNSNDGTLLANSRQVKTTDNASATVKFGLEKTTGTEYTVVFWADYVNPDTKDLYYDTATKGLKAVTFKNPIPTDLDGEAFCGRTTIGTDGIPVSTTITLKHSVAQVNIKTTTQLTGKQSVKVNYGLAADANAPMSSFNAIDGAVTVAKTIAGVVNTVDNTQIPSAAAPYTFHTFYTFAPQDQQGLINMEIAMCKEANGTDEAMIIGVPNVPLQANYRTNIIGDFGKDMTIFSVSCDATWEDEELEPDPWSGTIPTANADYKFSGGTGTQGSPYIIASHTDLAQLAANVNGGTDYSGVYFKLNKDLNMGNKPWEPIGKFVNWSDAGNHFFKGIFDGNKKQIKNLKVEKSDWKCVGLFGYVAQGTIANLHVKGNIVNNTSTSNNSEYCGGICGSLIGNASSSGNSAIIKNCSFEGTVTYNASTAGGICGYIGSGAIISASKNSGTVKGKKAGGVVGSVASSGVYGCYNEGTVIVTDASGYGGGVAFSYGDAGVGMAGCYNIGEVKYANGVTPPTPSKLGAIYSKEASGKEPTGVCYVKQSYDRVCGTDYEKVFSTTAWPDGNATGDNNFWYANTTNDGTYTRTVNGATVTFTNCKFWESIGSWNGGTPVYPKLWWEQ